MESLAQVLVDAALDGIAVRVEPANRDGTIVGRLRVRVVAERFEADGVVHRSVRQVDLAGMSGVSDPAGGLAVVVCEAVEAVARSVLDGRDGGSVGRLTPSP